MLRFGRKVFAGQLALAVLVLALASAGAAMAATGGASAPGSGGSTPTTGRPGKAKLLKNGKAIPPSNAPARVVRAIKAANRIHKKPYIYGGGHRSFKSRGYDCSGAVSYVLHAAGMLKSPLPSGPMMSWGLKGKGRWITVYANGGHAYAVIAGLRWDTSAVGEKLNHGSGPRWRHSKRSRKGYKARHFRNY